MLFAKPLPQEPNTQKPNPNPQTPVPEPQTRKVTQNTWRRNECGDDQYVSGSENVELINCL